MYVSCTYTVNFEIVWEWGFPLCVVFISDNPSLNLCNICVNTAYFDSCRPLSTGFSGVETRTMGWGRQDRVRARTGWGHFTRAGCWSGPAPPAEMDPRGRIPLPPGAPHLPPAPGPVGPTSAARRTFLKLRHLFLYNHISRGTWPYRVREVGRFVPRI